VPPRYAFHLEDLRAFHLVRAICHACAQSRHSADNTAVGPRGYTRIEKHGGGRFAELVELDPENETVG
jgi:hypothetical protein